MTLFPSVTETWESTRVSKGRETCLNTDLKLEHYSVKHSSSITSRLLGRVWIEFEFESPTWIWAIAFPFFVLFWCTCDIFVLPAIAMMYLMHHHPSPYKNIMLCLQIPPMFFSWNNSQLLCSGVQRMCVCVCVCVCVCACVFKYLLWNHWANWSQI